jgi:hypothetical protein
MADRPRGLVRHRYVKLFGSALFRTPAKAAAPVFASADCRSCLLSPFSNTPSASLVFDGSQLIGTPTAKGSWYAIGHNRSTGNQSCLRRKAGLPNSTGRSRM